jgi:hypothetical protein
MVNNLFLTYKEGKLKKVLTLMTAVVLTAVGSYGGQAPLPWVGDTLVRLSLSIKLENPKLTWDLLIEGVNSKIVNILDVLAVANTCGIKSLGTHNPQHRIHLSKGNTHTTGLSGLWDCHKSDQQ